MTERRSILYDCTLGRGVKAGVPVVENIATP